MFRNNYQCDTHLDWGIGAATNGAQTFQPTETGELSAGIGTRENPVFNEGNGSKFVGICKNEWRESFQYDVRPALAE